MKITIDLTEETIKKCMEPDTEVSSILNLFKYVVPHYDYVENVKIGAVKISGTTANFIIGCLREAEGGNRAVMTWVNYGFSVDQEMKDFKARIDMDKITYKEE